MVHMLDVQFSQRVQDTTSQRTSAGESTISPHFWVCRQEIPTAEEVARQQQAYWRNSLNLQARDKHSTFTPPEESEFAESIKPSVYTEYTRFKAM